MTQEHSKFAAAAGLVAAFSMAATPAAALDLPVVTNTPVEVETGAAQEANWDRYRYRRYRHRNRVDAGDVIAGVLVLGTIAAIASSASNRDRDRYRDRDYRYRDRDYRYRDYRGDRRDRDYRSDYDSRGMERAADMCIDEVERGRDRVDVIDEARRTNDGWRISGRLENGGSWQCWIDNNGRIRNIDLRGSDYSSSDDYHRDDGYSAAPVQGDQWSADAYTRARASTRTSADEGYSYRENSAPASGQPAYPGGPVDGDVDMSGSEGWEGDGRYTTAQTPDFGGPGS